MAFDFNARMTLENRIAAQRGRAPSVAAVFTSAGLPLKSAPARLTATPHRFQAAVASTYENEKNEVIQIQKTAASYDLVAGDLTAFLNGREWTSSAYGLLLEFLLPQGSVLPPLTFTIAGADAFGTPISIPISTRQKAAGQGTRDEGWICALPSVNYNGAQIFRPFALRPQFGAAPLPLLKNITCTFTAAPNAGTVLTYTVLTRGTPELDELVAGYYARLEAINRASLASAMRAGDIVQTSDGASEMDFDTTGE